MYVSLFKSVHIHLFNINSVLWTHASSTWCLQRTPERERTARTPNRKFLYFLSASHGRLPRSVTVPLIYLFDSLSQRIQFNDTRTYWQLIRLLIIMLNILLRPTWAAPAQLSWRRPWRSRSPRWGLWIECSLMLLNLNLNDLNLNQAHTVFFMDMSPVHCPFKT